jgi:hypothetical protein
VITDLIGDSRFNGPHRADLGAGHAVPAMPQIPAIGLAVLVQGHKVPRADLFAQGFVQCLAAVTFLEINFGWHLYILLIIIKIKLVVVPGPFDYSSSTIRS